MPDSLSDEPDQEVRRLLSGAAHRSVPPGPFDLAAALHGGQRRAARRRLFAATGSVAVAMLVMAVAVLPSLGTRSAAPPAGDRRPTSAAERLQDTLAAQAELERILADPEANPGVVHFSRVAPMRS